VTNGKKEAWKGYLCVATERKVKTLQNVKSSSFNFAPEFLVGS
jgi:hypothetical protein